MVTVSYENASRTAPSTSDLSSWAGKYGLTFPVVSDPGATVDALYDPSGSTRPTYVLLGPGAEILSIGGSKPSDSAIEAALPTPYP